MLTLWLDYNESMQKQKYAESFFARWYTRLAFFLIAITYGITMGYSRVVLGAHSWN